MGSSGGGVMLGSPRQDPHAVARGGYGVYPGAQARREGHRMASVGDAPALPPRATSGQWGRCLSHPKHHIQELAVRIRDKGCTGVRCVVLLPCPVCRTQRLSGVPGQQRALRRVNTNLAAGPSAS